MASRDTLGNRRPTSVVNHFCRQFHLASTTPPETHLDSPHNTDLGRMLDVNEIKDVQHLRAVRTAMMQDTAYLQQELFLGLVGKHIHIVVDMCDIGRLLSRNLVR